MEIIPYEDLVVTTMTMIMALSNGVNTEAAFHLLPITRIAIQQTRESSKCKLPHCIIPGSILSMRYRGNTRGVIRSNSDPFKNAVTIDISTRKKNISLKLSSFSIQMCGASSREDGIEAATHVLNHLKRIQHILYRIQSDPVRSLAAIEWVKNNTRGAPAEKPYWDMRHFTNVILRIYRPIPDHSITKPMSLIPTDLDQEITVFLLSLCDDFLYHSDLCRKLDFIPNIHTIIDEPLELKHVDEAMVNYNYSLGFEVDRANLNQYIDGANGFIARYNNALATCVTIELPYEPPLGTVIKRRKNKIPHHTFLVYRSGSITQSGPGGGLMRDAYYLFMYTIAQLRPYIQYMPATLSAPNTNYNWNNNPGPMTVQEIRTEIDPNYVGYEVNYNTETPKAQAELTSALTHKENCDVNGMLFNGEETLNNEESSFICERENEETQANTTDIYGIIDDL
ncbi:Hypothetical protein HVR_LOCUS606 [uncultured virus]|nr:Hypothetical protein HVR_LOCUS606 [uncultured virus]